MKVKLGDLLLGAKALNEFVDSADLDTGEHVKLDWRLGHNARKSAVEVRAFEEKRSKIQDKHVRKDKDGNPVPVTEEATDPDGNAVKRVVEGQVYIDNPLDLNKSIVELLETVTQVDIHLIPLEWFEGTSGAKGARARLFRDGHFYITEETE